MSVKLGRMLEAWEEVDHIDNDKTNDSLDNLQILCGEENRKKYRNTQNPAAHGTYANYRHGCRCDECVRAFRDYQKTYYHRHKTKARKEDRVYTKDFLIRQAIQEQLGRAKQKKEVAWLQNNEDPSTVIVFGSAVDFNRFVKLGYDTQALIENADHTYSVSSESLSKKPSLSSKAIVEMECEFCHKIFTASKSNRIGKHIYCSRQCYADANKGKPGKPQKLVVTKEQLLKDIAEIGSYTGVGAKYGVSCNAIKKRCKTYNILDEVAPIIKQHIKQVAIQNNPNTNRRKTKHVQ